MIIIIAVIILFILANIPIARCFCENIFSVLYYCIIDVRQYFKEKRYNNAPYGQIRAYVADNAVSFGCGKTLSSVRYLCQLFNKYDGKLVWCPKRQILVTQKIRILSNVELKAVPYQPLESLAQFVLGTGEDLDKLDEENGTLTVTYLFIDEASSQLNSRSFKSNFDPLFISRLLTSRHVRASIIYTSQRFNMVDKLLREVTNIVVGCRKLWRFELQNIYDAFEIENASSPLLVAPLKRDCYFIPNALFFNYDTFSMLKRLEKSFSEDDMMTPEEILALQQPTEAPNMEVVRRPSRFFTRREKKKNTVDK